MSVVSPRPSNDMNATNIKENLEKSISVLSKDRIKRILDEVQNLSDVEKFLLYLRLPTGLSYSEPTPKSDADKVETTQAVTWIQSHLDLDPDISLPKQDVYDEYRLYCANHGLKYLPMVDFGKVMRQEFPNIKQRRLGQRGQSKYCYSGLKRRLDMEAPTLPCLNVTPSQPKTPTDASSLTTACVQLTLEWAYKLLNAQFATLNDLAVFLLCNLYVNSNSVAAFTVLSSMKSIPYNLCKSNGSPPMGTDKHREAQAQLKKKLQQQKWVREQKQRLCEMRADNEKIAASSNCATPTKRQVSPVSSREDCCTPTKRQLTPLFTRLSPRGFVSPISRHRTRSYSSGNGSSSCCLTPTSGCTVSNMHADSERQADRARADSISEVDENSPIMPDVAAATLTDRSPHLRLSIVTTASDSAAGSLSGLNGSYSSTALCQLPTVVNDGSSPQPLSFRDCPISNNDPQCPNIVPISNVNLIPREMNAPNDDYIRGAVVSLTDTITADSLEIDSQNGALYKNVSPTDNAFKTVYIPVSFNSTYITAPHFSVEVDLSAPRYRGVSNNSEHSLSDKSGIVTHRNTSPSTLISHDAQRNLVVVVAKSLSNIPKSLDLNSQLAPSTINISTADHRDAVAGVSPVDDCKSASQSNVRSAFVPLMPKDPHVGSSTSLPSRITDQNFCGGKFCKTVFSAPRANETSVINSTSLKSSPHRSRLQSNALLSALLFKPPSPPKPSQSPPKPVQLKPQSQLNSPADPPCITIDPGYPCHPNHLPATLPSGNIRPKVELVPRIIRPLIQPTMSPATRPLIRLPFSSSTQVFDRVAVSSNHSQNQQIQQNPPILHLTQPTDSLSLYPSSPSILPLTTHPCPTQSHGKPAAIVNSTTLTTSTTPGNTPAVILAAQPATVILENSTFHKPSNITSPPATKTKSRFTPIRPRGFSSPKTSGFMGQLWTEKVIDSGQSGSLNRPIGNTQNFPKTPVKIIMDGCSNITQGMDDSVFNTTTRHNVIHISNIVGISTSTSPPSLFGRGSVARVTEQLDVASAHDKDSNIANTENSTVTVNGYDCPTLSPVGNQRSCTYSNNFGTSTAKDVPTFSKSSNHIAGSKADLSMSAIGGVVQGLVSSTDKFSFTDPSETKTVLTSESLVSSVSCTQNYLPSTGNIQGVSNKIPEKISVFKLAISPLSLNRLNEKEYALNAIAVPHVNTGNSSLQCSNQSGNCSTKETSTESVKVAELPVASSLNRGKKPNTLSFVKNVDSSFKCTNQSFQWPNTQQKSHLTSSHKNETVRKMNRDSQHRKNDDLLLQSRRKRKTPDKNAPFPVDQHKTLLWQRSLDGKIMESSSDGDNFDKLVAKRSKSCVPENQRTDWPKSDSTGDDWARIQHTSKHDWLDKGDVLDNEFDHFPDISSLENDALLDINPSVNQELFTTMLSNTNHFLPEYQAKKSMSVEATSRNVRLSDKLLKQSVLLDQRIDSFLKQRSGIANLDPGAKSVDDQCKTPDLITSASNTEIEPIIKESNDTSSPYTGIKPKSKKILTNLLSHNFSISENTDFNVTAKLVNVEPNSSVANENAANVEVTNDSLTSGADLPSDVADFINETIEKYTPNVFLESARLAARNIVPRSYYDSREFFQAINQPEITYGNSDIVTSESGQKSVNVDHMCIGTGENFSITKNFHNVDDSSWCKNNDRALEKSPNSAKKTVIPERNTNFVVTVSNPIRDIPLNFHDSLSNKMSPSGNVHSNKTNTHSSPVPNNLHQRIPVVANLRINPNTKVNEPIFSPSNTVYVTLGSPKNFGINSIPNVVTSPGIHKSLADLKLASASEDMNGNLSKKLNLCTSPRPQIYSPSRPQSTSVVVLQSTVNKSAEKSCDTYLLTSAKSKTPFMVPRVPQKSGARPDTLKPIRRSLSLPGIESNLLSPGGTFVKSGSSLSRSTNGGSTFNPIEDHITKINDQVQKSPVTTSNVPPSWVPVSFTFNSQTRRQRKYSVPAVNGIISQNSPAPSSTISPSSAFSPISTSASFFNRSNLISSSPGFVNISELVNSTIQSPQTQRSSVYKCAPTASRYSHKSPVEALSRHLSAEYLPRTECELENITESTNQHISNSKQLQCKDTAFSQHGSKMQNVETLSIPCDSVSKQSDEIVNQLDSPAIFPRLDDNFPDSQSFIDDTSNSTGDTTECSGTKKADIRAILHDKMAADFTSRNRGIHNQHVVSGRNLNHLLALDQPTVFK